MTEEENKAIDILINEIADIVVGEYCTHCKICGNENAECYYTKAIGTVCNIIIKQQKEIEEISREELNTIISCIDKHYISKDRIREKIYELEKDIETHSIYEENWNKINVLKELLEE